MPFWVVALFGGFAGAVSFEVWASRRHHPRPPVPAPPRPPSEDPEERWITAGGPATYEEFTDGSPTR